MSQNSNQGSRKKKSIASQLKRFGVTQFREGQKIVVDNVLAGIDTLAIMPTGAGKSLCYQLPATLLPGITLVISPLISLMKDQLEKLQALDIQAVQVNSSLTNDEEIAALERIKGGGIKIVFCTPERLVSKEFLEVFDHLTVSLVVIDEAHCISQWGHDFRPAYLELAGSIKALTNPPILALTATATDDVTKDIGKQLGRTELTVINIGIYRANLRYRVSRATNQEEKYKEAIRLIQQTTGTGIVYAATVKAVNELYERLKQHDENVACYHGKLSTAERKENQELFMSGERRVMIATNAFGMGIDKPDTRFVVHLQMPANLEAYYQESGRAGRDGASADCTLIFLEDDKRIQQFFLAKHYPDSDELRLIYNGASDLNQPFTFNQLQAELKHVPESRLKICINLLKESRLLRQDRKLNYSVGAKMPNPASFASLADQYKTKQERDHQALEKMIAYARSAQCRWKLILDYFGDDNDMQHCCTCDNCVSPPVIAIDESEALVVQSDEAIKPAPTISTFAIGSKVKVPKYNTGVVLSVEGDNITVQFPEGEPRTFLASYVQLVKSKKASEPA